MPPTEYLDFAIELAGAAGDVLKHYMDREKQVQLKGRGNLVTVADKESEALVIRRIRERYPDHAVLAEESGASGAGTGRWIIDPLDGTTNFASSGVIRSQPPMPRFGRFAPPPSSPPSVPHAERIVMSVSHLKTRTSGWR